MQAKKFTMVTPNQLDLSLAHLRQCSESSIKKMVSSLEKCGQLNPIIAAGDEKNFILVDGFKRQQAAVIIGMDKLSTQVLPLSKVNMKAYIYLLNRNDGFSFIEECLLIHELVEKDGLTQTEISVMLERHKSWVSRRLNIYRNLNSKVIDDIRTGLIPSGSGRSLAQLPQCNQVDFSAAILRDNLKVNEIKRLVNLWKKADSPESKRFVVEKSRKALELSQMDYVEKIDPRMPQSVRGLYKAVCNLRKNALILKQQSMKGFGAMNMEIETILYQALEKTDKESQEAISCAYASLQKEEKTNETGSKSSK